MTWFDGGDDDQAQQKPDEGGPEAGDYKPTDPNMPIPGESEGIEKSELG